jgi:predicted phosphate transport protein (TIGR00153 family)
MSFQLKPADEKFFNQVLEMTKVILLSTDTLESALRNPDKVGAIMQTMDEYEHQADEITAKILARLNKTFITPIDREDIYALANKLDDVVDGIQGIVERLHLYNAGKASDGVKELAELISRSGKQIDKACNCLVDIRKYRLKLEARCSRIEKLEAKGDKLYRQEVARLFRKGADPLEVIKWKEILAQMEEVLDTSEDVADLLKGVLLKYA